MMARSSVTAPVGAGSGAVCLPVPGAASFAAPPPPFGAGAPCAGAPASLAGALFPDRLVDLALEPHPARPSTRAAPAASATAVVRVHLIGPPG